MYILVQIINKKSVIMKNATWSSRIGACLIFSCIGLVSCEKDTSASITEEVVVNLPPTVNAQSFEVPENSSTLTSIGFVIATDPENDSLRFTLVDSEEPPVRIDFNTGELQIRDQFLIDYETTTHFNLTVSVADRTSRSNAEITINILDEDDGLLSNIEKDVSREFVRVVLGSDIGVSGVLNKWSGAIKVFLDGDISTYYRNQVEAQNEIFNALMTDGTTVELVPTLSEANIHLYLGDLNEIKDLWPDIYDFAIGGDYGGVAQIDLIDENNVILAGRTWVGYENKGTYNHELGHLLGFSHSTKCDLKLQRNTSMMCGSVYIEGLTIFDEYLIKAAYHPNMLAGYRLEETQEIIEEILLGDSEATGKNAFGPRSKSMHRKEEIVSLKVGPID